jgi:hypothetical protein
MPDKYSMYEDRKGGMTDGAVLKIRLAHDNAITDFQLSPATYQIISVADSRNISFHAPVIPVSGLH